MKLLTLAACRVPHRVSLLMVASGCFPNLGVFHVTKYSFGNRVLFMAYDSLPVGHMTAFQFRLLGGQGGRKICSSLQQRQETAPRKVHDKFEYRRSVGICLFNSKGLVFAAR
jgi:hypothetical protein